MKTILKVILVLLLVLAGNRTIANATSENHIGRDEGLSLRHRQDNKIGKTACDFIFSFGEFASVLVIESIQRRETPSGNPTSSSCSSRISANAAKNMVVSINPRRDKQYDVGTPFYCLLPNGYYVFALRHIII